MSERHARHGLVPEWSQHAVRDALIGVLPGRAPDAIADRFLVLAAAIGFREVHVAGEAGSGLQRALRLDPSCAMLGLSPALVNTELHNHLREQRRIFIAATHSRASQLDPVLRVHARGYVSGPTGARVADATEQIKRRPHKNGHIGAHLAAASLLGSALAAVGAVVPPRRPLPRAPAHENFAVDPHRRMPWARKLRLLLVGGGGALAHAVLEGIVTDDLLRNAFSRVVIVDPDLVEDSNLSRQTLYSTGSIGSDKASATCIALERLWSGPEFVSLARAFEPAMIADEKPNVVVLAADNFAARSAAWRAVREARLDDTLVVCAGSEFFHGQTRALRAGSGCFDCGPERLAEAAAKEQLAHAARASCSAAPTPSNVLINAWVGALAALQMRNWLITGSTESRQLIVNAYLPEHYWAGLAVGACECRRAPSAVAGAA